MVRDYLNPLWFLRIGGVALIAIGILGFVVWDLDGGDPNSTFYLTGGENLAHVVLGVVAIAASMSVRDAMLLKWLVVIVGIVSLFFGVYGFFLEDELPDLNTFDVANLENPIDNLLHLVIGVWALASAFLPDATMRGGMRGDTMRR